MKAGLEKTGGVLKMNVRSRSLLGVFVGLLLMSLFWAIPGRVLAMQFSEPVLIGDLSYDKGHKLHAKMALPSSLERTYYDFQSSKGVVRIWLNQNRIGSAVDINNTIAANGNLHNRYYEVPNDQNLPIFVRAGDGSVDETSVEVFGKDKSGKFIKYVGYDNFYKLNTGGREGAMGKVAEVKAQGDTLIVYCYALKRVQVNGNTWKYVKADTWKWRYLLKWDEKARWFGIAFEKL